MSLIEPVLSSAALAAQINATRPEPGSLAVWWLGQSGYAIKARRGLLIVDPYLSEHLTTKYAATERPHVRMTRCPILGYELRGVDLVLVSHKHSDHLDPGTMPDLLYGSPEALLALPAAIVEHAETLGIQPSRMVGMIAGSQLEHAGFSVRAIPSAHETLDPDAEGRHPCLGFVIEAEGLRLYQSGDSLAYPGLRQALGPGTFDVLFLPINGKDPARGVAGNMSAAEAVDLAAEVRPRFVVPHHYDMFTFNTVPVSEFEAEAARLPMGVTPKVLRCGERWSLRVEFDSPL